MSERTIKIPKPVSSPKVLDAEKKPYELHFEEWFSTCVLASPKWLEGESNAIVSAKLEMHMELEERFSACKPGDEVVVTDEEYAFCSPIARDHGRQVNGALGPKSNKFVYAWTSAAKVKKDAKAVEQTEDVAPS
jgi:hypothetical protein